MIRLIRDPALICYRWKGSLAVDLNSLIREEKNLITLTKMSRNDCCLDLTIKLYFPTYIKVLNVMRYISGRSL